MSKKLDKNQIGMLKRLVRDDEWDVLMLAMGNYRDEIGSLAGVSGGTDFETLRDLHKRQGGIEHLTEFFERIEKLDA